MAMADPLSVAASIIAVVSAADTACKTLAKVRSFRNAPNEILALNNEVADLKLIFDCLDAHAHGTPGIAALPHTQLLHLSTLLAKAKAQLLTLENLLHTRFIKSDPGIGKFKVSGLRWIRAKETVENIQRNLRNHRLDIVLQLTTINAYVLCLPKQSEIVTRPRLHCGQILRS